MKKLILGAASVAILGFLPQTAFAVTYYDCVKEDGSISYRVEPCLKGEKESRRFQVNLDDFDSGRKESVGSGAAKSLDLYKERNGNFFVPGSVGGYPVSFIVDTGASITSISKQAASVAGIRECQSRRFNTANGDVVGCVATAPSITFGGFRLSNVEVAVMPNMTGALLGMNVLSQFKMEQHGSVMRIIK
jgi:clan AA aspartic protease (TIGR02281 family)